MSGAVVGISGDLGDRLGRAAGPRVIETGNRGRNAVASRRRAASVPATAAVFTVALLGVFAARRRGSPCRCVPRFGSPSWGSVASVRSGAGLRDSPAIQGMLWPISFSIAATLLVSDGATTVMAVPVRPARPVRPMRWT